MSGGSWFEPGPRVLKILAPIQSLIAGFAGGALFAWLDVPLGWMLGSMAATMLITISGRRIASPQYIRPPMVVLLGLAIGAGFQPQMVAQMGQWIPSLIIVFPMLALTTFLGTQYFRRAAGYDRLTAIYCATPGGLSEIVMLAESTGADVRNIALIHASRLALNITILSIGVGFFIDLAPVSRGASHSPFLPDAGTYADLGLLVILGVVAWRIGKRLGMPAPHMTAPLLLSALIHLAGWTIVEIPTALISAAQIVVGAGIGCRFAGTTISVLGRVFLHGMAFIAIVLCLCLILAFGLSPFVGQPVPTVVLAFAPGGLTELSLLSYAAGLDAGYVAAHHLVRQFTVVGVAPFVSRSNTRNC